MRWPRDVFQEESNTWAIQRGGGQKWRNRGLWWCGKEPEPRKEADRGWDLSMGFASPDLPILRERQREKQIQRNMCFFLRKFYQGYFSCFTKKNQKGHLTPLVPLFVRPCLSVCEPKGQFGFVIFIDFCLPVLSALHVKWKIELCLVDHRHL